jgi:hypothetical protein
MKKRRSANSSLELFLDTICNVFGGILFIAILIAIQIQQTEGIIKPIEAMSPEKITEVRQKLDQISADIAAAKVLLETLQASMPKPKDPAEQERADMFYKLSAAKGAVALKEAELLNLRLAMEKEMLDWEDKIKTVEATLRQREGERQKIDQDVEQQEKEQQAIKTSSETLQSEIDDLNRQIAQKEKNLKSSETNHQRTETIYLPKLHDAEGKRGVYFLFRFNRFYKVNNRGDFDYTGNELGIPKRNRGIAVDDTEESIRQIRSLLLQGNNSTDVYLSVFVYGDSADQWHIIRDLIITAGFKYELIPTADDTPWSWRDNSGPASVM